MKKIISAVALSAAFLGIGLAAPTPVQAAKLTVVPKNMRSAFGNHGELDYLMKFTKTTYNLGTIVKSEKGNWVITKSDRPVNGPLKLAKKLKSQKTFTLTTKNKYGYRKLQTKNGKYISTQYYKLKGKLLTISDSANGKEFADGYTKLPTLASRKAFFGK